MLVTFPRSSRGHHLPMQTLPTNILWSLPTTSSVRLTVLLSITVQQRLHLWRRGCYQRHKYCPQRIINRVLKSLMKDWNHQLASGLCDAFSTSDMVAYHHLVNLDFVRITTLGSLLIVRLSYQLDTVRPWCLSTKTLSTETTYQQDHINIDLLSTSLIVGELGSGMWCDKFNSTSNVLVCETQESEYVWVCQ
jgi:hypothetical protein